jgi:hypothetical protein
MKTSDYIGHQMDVVVLAQMYLDSQRRKQKAVPRKKRDAKWRQRSAKLDEWQKSIDFMLEA